MVSEEEAQFHSLLPSEPGSVVSLAFYTVLQQPHLFRMDGERVVFFCFSPAGCELLNILYGYVEEIPSFSSGAQKQVTEWGR